ncbi:hypothetical protein GGI42DRAFT_284686 [Trichoderma sp. SZMC 28013]
MTRACFDPNSSAGPLPLPLWLLASCSAPTDVTTERPPLAEVDAAFLASGQLRLTSWHAFHGPLLVTDQTFCPFSKHVACQNFASSSLDASLQDSSFS